MNQRILATLLLATSLPMAAHAAVSVSINIAPPPLPVYAQPAIPAPGYLWTPGYWRWDNVAGEYFWVPGTWVAPPYVGALWTPGYWGWSNGIYAWHGGYWGTHIGFYGGVNYGFGYVGHGYEGGYWNGGVFNYNRSVNNINTNIVHNVYEKRVVENNTRVSFNGGQGGLGERPTAEERAARNEPHTQPTPLQRQHEQVAMHTPEQRMSVNHGAPTMAATPRPAAVARPAALARGPSGPQHAEVREQRQAQPARPMGAPQHEQVHQAATEHAHPQQRGGGEHREEH